MIIFPYMHFAAFYRKDKMKNETGEDYPFLKYFGFRIWMKTKCPAIVFKNVMYFKFSFVPLGLFVSAKRSRILL